MGKIVTPNEVKDILQISGSTYDAVINALIPPVEDYILTYCAITQDSASLQPGLKLVASNLINYQLQRQAGNIASEKIGNYAVSYTNNYSPDLIQTMRPYRKAKLIQDPYYYTWQETEWEEFEDATE